MYTYINTNYTKTHTDTDTQTNTYTNAYTHLNSFAYICIHTNTDTKITHVYTLHTCIHRYRCTGMYAQMNTHTHTFILCNAIPVVFHIRSSSRDGC